MADYKLLMMPPAGTLNATNNLAEIAAQGVNAQARAAANLGLLYPATVPIVTGTGGASYGGVTPITLYVKSVTVLTVGAPADIATITIPSGITRFHLVGSVAANSQSLIIAETAAGTLAGASFTLFDAAAGGGITLCTASTGPVAAGNAVVWSNNGSITLSASSTIYIRQTANSANAGTCSFYITIFPLP